MAQGWHRIGFPVGYRKVRLEVISERIAISGSRGPLYLYPCRCSCGREKLLTAAQLNANRSCGCAWEEAKRHLPNRNRTHGGRSTRLYGVWQAMLNRCRRSDMHNSHRYHGRGIVVCEEWQHDFVAFHKWAMDTGYQIGLQLDRIDNNGNYEPSNCRWVTCTMNNHNRGRDTKITAFGETKCALEWARDLRCRVSDSTILYRLRKLGWDSESAIATPAFGHKVPARIQL